MDGRIVALVAAAVVLAGCGGALDGSTADRGTPTPLHVAAPGVTDGGVSDPGRLVDAHAASLRDRSYAVRTNRTVLHEGGRGRIVTELRVGADRERFLLAYRTTGDLPSGLHGELSFDAWSDGESRHVRVLDRSGTFYRTFSPDLDEFFTGFDGVHPIRDHVGVAGSATVRQVDREGWIAYRLEAEGSNASAVVVVDSFGLIHEFRAELPAERVEWLDRGRVVLTVTYSSVGSAEIPRPGWIDDAEESTPGPLNVGYD